MVTAYILTLTNTWYSKLNKINGGLYGMSQTNSKEKIREYISKYDLNPYFSEELINHMTLVKFDRGEDIITLGSKMDYYYLHIEGKLKIYTLLENGKKVLIRFYSPLSVLGDLEYSFDFPCRAFVEALTPAELIAIPMILYVN